METNFSLKDQLFNRDTVTDLAANVHSHYQAFDLEDFVESCLLAFDSLALKERMVFMSQSLKRLLPEDYYEATEIMLKASRLNVREETFVYGAFCEYVALYGCSKEYLDHSLSMLGEYTKTFSAEFAIRAFINAFPEESFAAMKAWALSDNVDQRRLASEGLRAKLPWAVAIDFDPVRGTEPLNDLYCDRERYVTRSVANHLNDLSKIEADKVIEILKRWQEEGKQDQKEMTYIINHSSRTLIKQCHLGALALQGYPTDVPVQVDKFAISTPSIVLGDSLAFEFEVRVPVAMPLMIDYQIDYPKANGKRSRKVFKIKKVTLAEGQSLKLMKQHPFKAMTTKKLYSGDYKVIVQINGKTYSQGDFHMEV